MPRQGKAGLLIRWCPLGEFNRFSHMLFYLGDSFHGVEDPERAESRPASIATPSPRRFVTGRTPSPPYGLAIRREQSMAEGCQSGAVTADTELIRPMFA